MSGYAGHWYLSDKSIRILLGERLPIILESFRQVKEQLGLYLKNPRTFQLQPFVEHHQSAMIVALQVDGLAQTSLEIVDDIITLFSVVEGEAVTRTAYVQSVLSRNGSSMIMVQDEEDGEQNTFIWKEGELSTVDQGVEMVFLRTPTFFFSDPELDTMEQLLEWIRSE